MFTSPVRENMRVAVIHDYLGIAEGMADWSPVRAYAHVDFFSTVFDDDDAVVDALAGYDVICAMRERLALTDALLARLPRLQLFVATSEVNRLIDFDAADRRGVTVGATASGSYARVATAELTWALVLATTRSLVSEDKAIREGTWQNGVYPALHGRTIGIIGLGGTGRFIARYAHAFGMKVLAYSPHLTDMAALESGAEAVSLAELLTQSDVVSLHLVLSESTQHLIDAEALALMKPSAVLINTSRGALVDEDALISALRDRSIAAAGLDTFAVEPLPAGHPFTRMDNVVLSPHAGGFTQETYGVWYQGTADAVLAFLEGREQPYLHRRDG